MTTESSSFSWRARHAGQWLGVVLLATLLVGLVGCGGGGGTVGGVGGGGAGKAELTGVRYGRLADVYGLQKTAEGFATALYQTDVMVGPDIQDERDSRTPNKRDDEILYDFISANPDTLQARLVITREIGTKEFVDAFDALGAKLRLVTPAMFGQDTSTRPYTVVPRNAAIELTFSASLGIDESFFVQRDAQGRIVAVKNIDAVQLLEIVGDPTDQKFEGDFRVIPTRYVPRGSTLILDPVLLGSEGLQYQVKNNAAGLPEAPDQVGANIRVALALEGALRIPALKGNSQEELIGRNNSTERSVIRDFRSGNHNDNSADIAQGFVRDPVTPKLVGEMVMYLEAVDDVDDFTQRLTIFKNDVAHRIDQADVIKLLTDNSGIPAAVTEVVRDPGDHKTDRHTRVIVRRTPGLKENDPRRLPGYPTNLVEREAWLVANAPRAVLVAEFAAGDPDDPASGDDPRLFLTFSPGPELVVDGYPQISPFAGAIVRFNKPMDLATIKRFDTLFFATRALLGPQADAEIKDFVTSRNIAANTFRLAKFITPHLVAGSVFDEDGSQTTIRLQPPLGFYLDSTMRKENAVYARYFLHVLSGKDGIKDLAGNSLDFQQTLGKVLDSLVIGFDIDTRLRANGQPLFADNLAVTVARRFVDPDEDEQPNYYRDDEYDRENAGPNYKAYPLPDLFGAVVYLPGGKLMARPAARVSKIADDLNQLPPPPQTSDLRFCPDLVSGQNQVVTATASVKFGQPLQNPLNPFGCRLETVWREIDMSLSRVDPYDFNLDVEQMFWAPFEQGPIQFDEFDQVSLFLGHSEWRPEPCVDQYLALPSFASSGLELAFAENFVRNKKIGVGKESQPAPHIAYVDQPLVIDANRAILEPNGINRYLPLPTFQKPYFVWRDETVLEQGGVTMVGSDIPASGQYAYDPYILSPFLNGNGRLVTLKNGQLTFTPSHWINATNFRIRPPSATTDPYTDGLVGAIALPLLGDFWTYPDSPLLPEGRGYVASGATGWQVSLTVQSAAQPNFRVYSGGGSKPGQSVDPKSPDWITARGGYDLQGQRTMYAGDNTFFWVRTDYLKRQTVVTNGFVELTNPHRMPSTNKDPRLGPYIGGALTPDMQAKFSFDFEPPLSTLPGGTAVIPEFRGAGAISSWWGDTFLKNPEKLDTQNFPLDPLKAGDAYIRKYDDRIISNQTRDYWTYLYNNNLTDWVSDLNLLMDPSFTSKYAGPSETFLPNQVKYFDWRFIMKNNVEANPPVSPTIDSFSVTYRFEKR